MLKILYAVQATGNGHISRASELLPYLRKQGEVDIFLSGSNSHLDVGLPIKYRSKGLSLFYNCNGGINTWAVMSNVNFRTLYREAKTLPVEQYDVVLNDFDFVTSWACKIKHKPSIQFGHQASFQYDNAPRPEKRNRLGEFILKNYCKATDHVGLHFWPYHENIFSPVIKKQVLEAEKTDKGFVVVYLNQYCVNELRDHFTQFGNVRFRIFSKDTKAPFSIGNLDFLPVNGDLFTRSLIACRGIITGGGFETPAEALYLNKNLMVVPIKGQYEQLCNARALKEWKIPELVHIHEITPELFYPWYEKSHTYDYRLLFSTAEIAEKALEKALEKKEYVK